MTPSRSRATICVSAGTPGIAMAEVLGKRGAAAPSTTASGAIAAMPASNSIAQCGDPVIDGNFCHGSGGGGSETCDPRQVLGSGTTSVFLAATAQQRRQIDPAGHDESANPRRATDLMCRQCDEIGAEGADLQSHLAGGLDGVTMEHGAMSPRNRGDLGYRLDNAGLVVGIHHRHQRRARIGAEQPVERVEGDDPLGTDRNDFGGRNRMTDRIVLDCRNEDPLATSPDQGKVIGFGPTADEDNAAWIHITEQTRDSRPSAFDDLARRSAAPMHRGWITPAVQRFGHGGRRFRPQRRRCVPVEVALGPRLTSVHGTARGDVGDHQPVPAAAGLRKVSQWTRPLVPRTRCSQTSASDTELK